MTDIVEQLREWADQMDDLDRDSDAACLTEAADEIVRLRYRLEEARNERTTLRGLIKEWAEATAAGAFEPILDSAYRERLSRARRALREEASK